jgi:hypothetical protein
MKKFGRMATMEQDLYEKSPLKDLYQKSPIKRSNTIYDKQGNTEFYNDTSPKAGIHEMLGTGTEGCGPQTHEAMQQAVRYDEKYLTYRDPSRNHLGFTPGPAVADSALRERQHLLRETARRNVFRNLNRLGRQFTPDLNHQQDNSKSLYRTQKKLEKRETNLGTILNMGKITEIRNKAKAIGKQNILNDFLVNAKTIDQQPIEKPLDMEKNWLRGGPKWEFLKEQDRTGKKTKFRYHSLKSGQSGNIQGLHGKTISPNKFTSRFGDGSNPFQTMYARGDSKGLADRALAESTNIKKTLRRGASTPEEIVMGMLQDSSDGSDEDSPTRKQLNMFDRDEWQETTKAWLFLPGTNGNYGRETPFVG